MSQPQSESGFWESRPFYTRAAILGLLLYSFVLAFSLLVFIVPTGELGANAILVVFLVVSLVVAWITWRFGRWLLVVASVWALANFLLNLPFLVPTLKHFNSIFDFGIALLALVGLLVATAAGTISFIQQRKGQARTGATRGERAVFTGIAAVTAGLVVISGVLTITGRASVSAEAKAGATTVNMKNTKFDPAEVEVAAGQTTKIVVKNSDLSVHTFTVKELGVDYGVRPGSEQLVELASPRAGSFEYICAIAGHEKMKGILVVK